MSERVVDRGRLLAWLMDMMRDEDDAAGVGLALAERHRSRASLLRELVRDIQRGEPDAHAPVPAGSGEHAIDFGEFEPTVVVEPRVQDPTRRR